MGRLQWVSGEIYEGEWKDDMMHGNGYIIDKDGFKKKIKFDKNTIMEIED